MKSLKGYLLIAAPSLLDPNFARSIVLIVQHDKDGAVGVVLNRPTTMTIAQAWKEVSEVPCIESGFIYQGGPCEGPLMVLHTHEHMAQAVVCPGVYFSTEEQYIQWLVENNVNEPIRFFVGYAGWSPGQLETELKTGSWYVVQAEIDQIFTATDELWLTLERTIALQASYPDLNPRLIPKDPTLN